MGFIISNALPTFLLQQEFEFDWKTETKFTGFARTGLIEIIYEIRIKSNNFKCD